MKILLADFLSFLHTLLVLFVLTAWTSNDFMILILYVTVIGSLHIHWFGNNDTCALTIMEQKLRGIEKKETFFGKLVRPVYKIEDKDISRLSYMITTTLLLIVLFKLKNQYNKSIIA